MTDLVSLTIQLLDAQGEARMWKANAATWQKLAGRYDDIREWLRLCEDNPEGHAQFYKECCHLIFPDQFPDEGEYPSPSDPMG